MRAQESHIQVPLSLGLNANHVDREEISQGGTKNNQLLQANHSHAGDIHALARQKLLAEHPGLPGTPEWSCPVSETEKSPKWKLM